MLSVMIKRGTVSQHESQCFQNTFTYLLFFRKNLHKQVMNIFQQKDLSNCHCK